MFNELTEQLGLGADSKVLVISTEGDTDPDYYRKIVW
jgi:diaminopropionate ammonia-lyase